MNKTDKIYIAGPISGVAHDNQHAFSYAEAFLCVDGWVNIVNPQKISPPDKNEPDVWLYYMVKSLELLSSCQVIFMLDGWKESVGAKVEHTYASVHDIAILYQDEYDPVAF